jgi:hypothetical protein
MDAFPEQEQLARRHRPTGPPIGYPRVHALGMTARSKGNSAKRLEGPPKPVRISELEEESLEVDEDVVLPSQTLFRVALQVGFISGSDLPSTATTFAAGEYEPVRRFLTASSFL